LPKVVIIDHPKVLNNSLLGISTLLGKRSFSTASTAIEIQTFGEGVTKNMLLEMGRFRLFPQVSKSLDPVLT